MQTTIRYIILTAVRDKLFAGLLAILVLIYAVSFLYGGTSIVEENEAATAFVAGSSRLLLVAGVIVFTCFHMRRSFDSKEIELLLSKPVGRFSFIMAYWIGLSAIAAALTAACFLMLFMVSFHVSGGMLLWLFSLLCELIIAITASLAISLIIPSAVTSVLGSLCFYFMSRMSGFFLAIVDSGHGGFGSVFSKVGAIFVKMVTVFTPRLDQFAESSWLVYTTDLSEAAIFVAAQSAIYVPLLLGLAYFDFRRKQF